MSAMLLSGLVAFPALLFVYYLYLQQRLSRRVAALRAINPTLTIKTAWYGGFGVIPGRFLGPIFRRLGFYFSEGWAFIRAYEPFADTEDDVFALVTPYTTHFHIANPVAVREITQRRPTFFPKPVEFYGVLRMYGENVVTTEHEDWKRLRRITAPQFSEKNNLHVQESTIVAMQQILSEWKSRENNKGEVATVDVAPLSVRLTLFVISDSAYGERLDLATNARITPPGFQMSLQQSLEIFATYLHFVLLSRKWMSMIPNEFVKSVVTAREEFGKHMRAVIERAKEARRNGMGVESKSRSTVLGSLVEAVEMEEEGKGMSESEMVSSAFVFLFAGHETTANTFSFALALLALYPEYQEKLYEETKLVTKGETPTYKNFPELRMALAIMHETLRIFPQLVVLPKSAYCGPEHTDTFQPILGKYKIPALDNPASPDLSRTYINLHIMGLHHNPRYWGDDAKAFRPERFLEMDSSATEDEGEEGKTLMRYAFAPFSVGTRACVGKKFAQVEFVCALAMIAQKYTWTVSNEMAPKEVRETPGVAAEVVQAAAKAELEKATFMPRRGVTLKPARSPLLTFRRRDA